MGKNDLKGIKLPDGSYVRADPRVDDVVQEALHKVLEALRPVSLPAVPDTDSVSRILRAAAAFHGITLREEP